MCIVVHTSAWDLREVLTLIVQKEASNFLEVLKKFSPPKRWSVSVALSASDGKGSKADRVRFTSREYVICDIEDLPYAKADCIEDLHRQIEHFGKQFGAVQVNEISQTSELQNVLFRYQRRLYFVLFFQVSI